MLPEQSLYFISCLFIRFGTVLFSFQPSGSLAIILWTKLLPLYITLSESKSHIICGFCVPKCQIQSRRPSDRIMDKGYYAVYRYVSHRTDGIYRITIPTTGGYCTVFIGGKYRSVSFSISCGITTAYTASTTRRRNAFSVLIPTSNPVQALPKAHPGGGPILVISLTKQSLTERITPVKPAPDCPPLFVNIVTVSPI